MKRTTLVLILLIASVVSLKAQKGKQFTEIEGETLTGKSMTFPASVKGKVTLVGMAYSKKSDENLKTWMNPIYNNFINPPKSAFLPTFEYDVNIYFIGMIKGFAKAAAGKIEKEMEKGIDKKLHPNVFLYKGSIKEYKQELDLGKKDVPYFFVLDQNGKIIYNTSGNYSEKKLEEIRAILDKNGASK